MFFKPHEVLEAEHYLKQGNPRAAANALLRSERPDHKDVVACKNLVLQQLVLVARQEYAQGAIWSAYEAVELARQLAPLNQEDAVFAEQLAKEAQLRRYKEEAVEHVYQQANVWLGQRKFGDVVRLLEDFLQVLSGNSLRIAEARLLGLLVQARTHIQNLERYFAEVEQALEQGDLMRAHQLLDGEMRNLVAEDDYRYKQLCARVVEAWSLGVFQRLLERARAALAQRDLPRALMHWQRLMALAPEHPEVQQLTREVVEAEKQLRHIVPFQAVQRREQRWVLDGNYLVVSREQVVFGVPRVEGIDIPLLGQLSSRHATLWRERTRYYLRPCLNKQQQPCWVQVNGNPLRDVCELRSGDRLALGRDSASALTFQFLQPVAGSGTALLMADVASAKRVPVANGACSHIILLDEELQLAPQPVGAIHLPLNKLPCGLRFVWQRHGLFWQTQGGRVLLDLDDASEGCDQGAVMVPMELALIAAVDDDESEGQWLGKRMVGQNLEVARGSIVRLKLSPADVE
ncbi:MAG: hypothetical protein NZM42_03140 [Gemmatales bacterium]|nr:hypothetical protein [Gemmatales bacterium]